MSEPLAWFQTDTEEPVIFPGCMDCCSVTGSPAAHEAAGAERMALDMLDDPDIMEPVWRETVESWHDAGHAAAPPALTPAIMPKKRSKNGAAPTEIETTE